MKRILLIGVLCLFYAISVFSQTREIPDTTLVLKSLDRRPAIMTQSGKEVNKNSSEEQEYGTFTDSRDGYNYKVLKIGTQTWMAENLVFKADSGCVQRQNGYMYNWQTAMKVAPIGWHLPSKEEWEILIAHLGQNKGIVFENLKANRYGFNAKFNTYSDPSLVASHDGEYFVWWSSSPANKTTSWKFVSGIENTVTFRGSSYSSYYGPFRKSERTDGSFVRLIKD